MGWEVGGRGHTYGLTYGQFTLIYGRNQHNILQSNYLPVKSKLFKNVKKTIIIRIV